MTITLQRIFAPIQQTVVKNGAIQSVAGGSITHVETGGTFVAAATPVVVADPNVGANSAIVITLKTVGGTINAVPAVTAITPGTGFTVTTGSTDTSTYNYLIIGS